MNLTKPRMGQFALFTLFFSMEAFSGTLTSNTIAINSGSVISGITSPGITTINNETSISINEGIILGASTSISNPDGTVNLLGPSSTQGSSLTLLGKNFNNSSNTQNQPKPNAYIIDLTSPSVLKIQASDRFNLENLEVFVNGRLFLDQSFIVDENQSINPASDNSKLEFNANEIAIQTEKPLPFDFSSVIYLTELQVANGLSVSGDILLWISSDINRSLLNRESFNASADLYIDNYSQFTSVPLPTASYLFLSGLIFLFRSSIFSQVKH